MCEAHSESAIRTGRLVVNLNTRVVSVDDQPVHLTGKEYGILELLSLRKGTTLTKCLNLNRISSIVLTVIVSVQANLLMSSCTEAM